MAGLVLEPSETERLLLASAGWSSTMSPWRAYHVLRRSLPSGSEPAADLKDELQLALLRHLEKKYGAFIYRDEENVEFAPGACLEPILRIGSAGHLHVNDDDAMMVEMPDNEQYEHNWKDAGGTGVPFRVRARAQMRMAATGTTSLLVWVVSGMGAIDEFHSVPYEQEMVDRLRAAINAMAERVTNSNEPDPEDDDMDGVMAMAAGKSNAQRTAEKDDPIIALIKQYEEVVYERLPLDRESKALKEQESGFKAQLMRLLVVTPQIKLPDGRVVSCTMVKGQSAREASKPWPRLDISKVPSTA